MATYSSVPAWEIPWTEGHGGLQPTGRKESDTTERLSHHIFTQLVVIELKQKSKSAHS